MQYKWCMMHLKFCMAYLVFKPQLCMYTTLSQQFSVCCLVVMLTHSCNNVAIVPLLNLLWGYCTKSCLVPSVVKIDKRLSIVFVVSIVFFQLENCTGHRGVHPQGIISTQVLSPTLRCCEGGMEGMGEMVCLVPVDLKDREESKE